MMKNKGNITDSSTSSPDHIEEKWTSLLENAPDIILSMDKDGNVEYINHFLPGIPPYQLVGKPIYQWILPAVKERIQRTFQKVLDSGEPANFEFVGIQSEGQTMWFSSRIGPVKIHDEITGLSMVLTDISERIKMENILKESEERFREIFEQHYDAIILLKPGNLECINYNIAAEALFGFDPQEPDFSFRRIFKNDEDYNNFKAVIHDGSSREFFISQFEFVRKDGSEVDCGVKGKTIKIRDDDVLYCSFRDIKERLEFEEKERRMQAELIHTNKMTSLGTLSSGIAHEINNPNNFILTNSQMVLEIWNDAAPILQSYAEDHGDFSLAGLEFDELTTIVPKLLNGNIEGCRRIMSIIGRLKEYSRPVDGKYREKVDINKVIHFSVSILNNQVKKHTDSLTLDLAENIPPFLGNSQQIEQVIINLLQNALHALPNKHASIEISSFVDTEKNQVVMRIKDEGSGIDREVIQRITEPFFTTKKDSGGTGLGLYISYSIISEHNGELKINSAPGEGTEAFIRFPILESETLT